MSQSADYAAFLASKQLAAKPAGFEPPSNLNAALFPFQRNVLEFMLRGGRDASFLDTGLGKTIIQLDWARCVAEHTKAPVLILAPLAVAAQTVREGAKFGIEARVCREQADVLPGVNVANYERLQKFDAASFSGVVLDESSILKSFAGRTRNTLIESFADTPYRLACTATPAPNDYAEIGNHSEFLGVMPLSDMLPRWFVNDSMNTGDWRLKGHAVESFWDWIASWARCVSKPSDIGYSDTGFALPELTIEPHIVEQDLTEGAEGALFRSVEMSATSLHHEKRRTVAQRAEEVAALVNDSNEAWVVWCDTDYEADELKTRIRDGVEVRGSDSIESKERDLMAFSEQRERVIITKPSIAGFGLNWQHCHNVAFVGVSYSYESFYQAVRRCWRFGQTQPVNVHVVMAQTEAAIWATVTRKAGDHESMKREMRGAMARAAGRTATVRRLYAPQKQARLPQWLKSA